MKVAAVVPFKCFTRAKGRLRAAYSDVQVEQILHALLADVLHALRSARTVDYVGVLTDDEAVAAVASAAGADVRVRIPDPNKSEVQFGGGFSQFYKNIHTFNFKGLVKFYVSDHENTVCSFYLVTGFKN